MKQTVSNMTSNKGNKVANQFIISYDGNDYSTETFQSYDSAIARKVYFNDSRKNKVLIDSHYWDYSVTTGKYRNQFLDETKKETQAKIDSGEYELVDLNS